MTRRYNGREKDLLDQIVELKKRVAALENGPQLRYTSIKGTSGVTFTADPVSGDLTISGTFRAKTAIAEAILFAGATSPGLYLYSLLTDLIPADFYAGAIGSTTRFVSIDGAPPPSGNYTGGRIYMQADSSFPGGSLTLIAPDDHTTQGQALIDMETGTGSGSGALIHITCANDDGTSGQVFIDGSVWLATTKVGFYNATPVTQPNVTGSRAGNAALASLLTQLANLGLIQNSTTA